MRTAEGFGASNEDVLGMGVHEGDGYVFSIQLRAVNGQPALHIALVAGGGCKLGMTRRILAIIGRKLALLFPRKISKR